MRTAIPGPWDGRDGVTEARVGAQMLASPGSPTSCRPTPAPDTLHVAVSDNGLGFQTDPRRPPPDEASRQGLVLIDSLADRWGTRDDGRRVWFELDRRA